ncbi:hypothetical protein [Bacillus sp. 165]|uniref:hypothetical protein n=1 Tax=Bacillus sp. 165 TaxID=1529117 RepID=UPI001ADAD5E3|nr:hypothetical protein [Bacillus sp. 165]MBO9129661.1 hypothetical protein [Bacillus sp. 165]
MNFWGPSAYENVRTLDMRAELENLINLGYSNEQAISMLQKQYSPQADSTPATMAETYMPLSALQTQYGVLHEDALSLLEDTSELPVSDYETNKTSFEKLKQDLESFNG